MTTFISTHIVNEIIVIIKLFVIGMKINLIILTIVITYTIVSKTIQAQGIGAGNFSSGRSSGSSNMISQGDSGGQETSDHKSRHDKNGIGLESMSGSSTSRYLYRKMRDFNAKGRFRSRGIGRYGTMSSETTNFATEGKIGRYGRRKPTTSKFKTRGKEKKYSRKINDNRFDIMGGLYEQHKHEGFGDYQASGNYTKISVKTKKQNGESMGNRRNSEFKSHNNQSTIILQDNWSGGMPF
ncbi:hypothetical protein MN116_000578 [Schistosoma mekongi]|uniref:Trematode Eggshell Synthesis domain containing protein n=1 Tax=Schistosoma mekongi TaxID=38744 RepID=A0AAE1ZD37_SCHME|nr:hypothetical protein MN116_000578 [Schistosoma mekongi]